MIYLKIPFFRSRRSFELSTPVVLLICIIIVSAPVQAQNGNSVYASDSARIDSSIIKAKKMARSNPAMAMEMLQKAKKESEQINYKRGVMKSILFEADYYYGVNLDEAIRKGYEALQYYEQNAIQHSMYLGDAERILADAYDEKGKKDSAAYFYYLISRQIEADSSFSPEFTVDMMMKLTGFTVRMNYDTTYLKRTIDQYLLRAQKASSQIPDSSPYKASIHFLEGVYYGALGQYNKASESFILYLQKRGNNIPLPRKLSAYVNISEAYMKAKNPKMALTYIDKAIEIGEQPQLKDSYSFYMSVINFIKARVLFQLEDYEGTVSLITQSLKTIEKAGTPLQLDAIEAHEVLSQAYQALGEKDKAIEHKNIYQQLHDSVLQRDRMDMVSLLEVRYGLEEKNRQIAEAKLMAVEAESKLRTKNFWLITSAGAITILLLLATLYWRNSLHKQRLQTEMITSMQQRREIELLNAAITGEERERNRLAMELHDGIGGILSAAKMNLEMGRRDHSAGSVADLEKGIKLVDKAGKELRKTAHKMMPENLIQEGLVTALEYFCDNLSSNDRTRIELQVLGTAVKLNPAFELSVYRIIQELLHNVIKHAKAKQALVQLSFDGSNLAVTVEDDGVGIDLAMEQASKPGIGLASVKQRVQAIKGTLTLKTAKDEGTSIYMEFEPEPLSL